LNAPDDDRSAPAKALAMASLVMAIGLEMVVPMLIGYWLDCRLGSKAVFAIIGGICGLSGGVWHFTRLAKSLGGKARAEQSDSNDLPP
jgi:F0F1-type ATP synthase assembly protein I